MVFVFKKKIVDRLSDSAYILGEPNSTQIVTLNQPALVRCLAGGPNIHVSWWKGDTMIPYTGHRLEVHKDYSLSIRNIEISDLGTYLCQAYTGIGKPHSISVTLKAIGTVQRPEDNRYSKYLIPPVDGPRPDYPIRPQPVQPPRVRPERPRPSHKGRYLFM